MPTKSEEKITPKKIPGYTPTGLEVVVFESKRNRQKYFADNSVKYSIDQRFQEIIDQCSNGWTKGEVLREDFNAKLKSYCEVLHDLDVQDITPDQVCERVIHFCEKAANAEPTLIGICNNVAVIAYLYTGNHKIAISTKKFVDFEIPACKFLSAL